MNLIKIDTTEVIFQNYEFGRGKIIISDLDNGSYSYYWGATMSETLEGFVKKVDSEYFAGKLCNEKYVFSGKYTAKGIRKFIKIEMKYDLPWYKFQICQKALRSEIKKIEFSQSQDEALRIIEGFSEIFCFDEDYHSTKEFLEIMKDFFSEEPWNFLETEYSGEFKFLMQLHRKLKDTL